MSVYRERVRDLIDRPGRPAAEGTGSPAFVGQVETVNPQPERFALLQPMTVLGAEVEGGAATVTATATPPMPVFLLGQAQRYDLLVCRFVADRWVAERRGAAPEEHNHPLPGCPCLTVPDTLSMSVQIQPTNGTNSVVFPSTIHYGPKPADLGAYRSDDPGWYSDPPVWSTNGWYKLRYIFSCQQGLYTLKATTTSDSPLPVPEWSISTWLIAALGPPYNTCTPFSLENDVWHSPEGQNDQVVAIHG